MMDGFKVFLFCCWNLRLHRKADFQLKGNPTQRLCWAIIRRAQSPNVNSKDSHDRAISRELQIHQILPLWRPSNFSADRCKGTQTRSCQSNVFTKFVDHDMMEKKSTTFSRHRRSRINNQSFSHRSSVEFSEACPGRVVTQIQWGNYPIQSTTRPLSRNLASFVIAL
jgi:hypothetical protein